MSGAIKIFWGLADYCYISNSNSSYKSCNPKSSSKSCLQYLLQLLLEITDYCKNTLQTNICNSNPYSSKSCNPNSYKSCPQHLLLWQREKKKSSLMENYVSIVLEGWMVRSTICPRNTELLSGSYHQCCSLGGPRRFRFAKKWVTKIKCNNVRMI